MIIKGFLNEQKYAFVIAKVAILFQTLCTLSIGTLLIRGVATGDGSHALLSSVLALDILFVCIHLSYRSFYTGPKITLLRFEKNALIHHIISSILALSVTLYIIIAGLSTMYELVCLSLASWTISLISGIIFFYKKYTSFL